MFSRAPVSDAAAATEACYVRVLRSFVLTRFLEETMSNRVDLCLVQALDIGFDFVSPFSVRLFSKYVSFSVIRL